MCVGGGGRYACYFISKGKLTFKGRFNKNTFIASNTNLFNGSNGLDVIYSRQFCNITCLARTYATLPSDHLFTFIVWWAIIQLRNETWKWYLMNPLCWSTYTQDTSKSFDGWHITNICSLIFQQNYELIRGFRFLHLLNLFRIFWLDIYPHIWYCFDIMTQLTTFSR